MTFVSEEAKAFKVQAGWIAKQAGIRTPLSCPVRLDVTLIPKNGTVMDLSNCLKVAEDALQGIAYDNDRQVKDIHLSYADADGVGGLIIEISEFIPPLPPIFEQECA